MRFIILLLILFINGNCEKKEKINCWDPWFGQCYFFYNNNIKPKEEIENSCRQPNSINYTGTTKPDSKCINNRVTGQILFDMSNKLVGEQIIPGIAVQCLCADKSKPGFQIWSKGNELNLETFPPNVPISTVSTDVSVNTNLYIIGTNLFCISNCLVGNNQSNSTYQVLKLRSNP